MTVLIPSAGLGTRLKPLTNYFNKTLIPVGKLPVISHILNNYDKKTEFIIALGHGGDHLKEYLDFFHPKNKIFYIKIKNFSGLNSGLNTTLKSCLKKIKSDFIFHVNDAILKENIYKSYKKDTLFLSEKYSDTNHFRKVLTKNNLVSRILDKRHKTNKNKILSYIGVAYVKDYKLFNDIININNSKFAELDYFKNSCRENNLEFNIVKKWYDTGTKETLEDTINDLSNFRNLNKLDEAIYFKDKNVIKFFTNKSLVKKRVKRAKILNKSTPKIRFFTNYFYTYKYIDGQVLSNSKPNLLDFISLLNFLEKKLWNVNKKIYISKFKNSCTNFYYYKSIERIKKFYKKNKILDTENTINGKNYPKLKELFRLIDWKEIFNGKPVVFHGDLHFENIIKTKNSFVLIDWRDSFDKNIKFGDIYYDFAKIYHGLLVKHSMVKENKFDVKIKEKKIYINIKKYKPYTLMIKYLFKYIQENGYSVYKLKIITSLIFLNISPLHDGKYGIFLYHLGKQMLSETLYFHSKNNTVGKKKI